MLLKISCIIIHSFRTPFPFVKCHCLRLIVFFLRIFFWIALAAVWKIHHFGVFFVYFFFLIIASTRLFFCRHLTKCRRAKEGNIKISSYVYACLHWSYPLISSENAKLLWGSLKCTKRTAISDASLLFFFELLIPSTKDTNGRYRNNHVIWISWHQWLLRILTDRLTR